MANLPVTPDELESFEARLHIRLPAAYTAPLMDPATQSVLRSESLGFLRARDRMMDFAALTEQVREQVPRFPNDAVVLFCPTDPNDGAFTPIRGHLRFLRPDRRDPARLGETVYAWDPARSRAARDCTIGEWIGTAIDSADDEILERAGVARPKVPRGGSIRVNPCAEIVHRLRRKTSGAAPMPEVGQWLRCAVVEIDSGVLYVTGAGLPPDPRSRRPVRPGTYIISVRLDASAVADHEVVAGLRFLHADVPTADRSAGFQDDVDQGGVAVYDGRIFNRRIRVDDREALAEQIASLAEQPCVVKGAGDTRIFVCPAGQGDGTYRGYVLSHGPPLGRRGAGVRAARMSRRNAADIRGPVLPFIPGPA